MSASSVVSHWHDVTSLCRVTLSRCHLDLSIVVIIIFDLFVTRHKRNGDISFYVTSYFRYDVTDDVISGTAN